MQDKQPLFTVIITTHNRRDILPRAIQSVLDQRYSNFECLVIDNGSTDDTADVIGKIQDERIHYISNPTPTQSCDAPRNLGIRLSKGDFISFLDDDDVWYPRKIEKVKSAFDLHTDIDAVCHNENMRIRGEIKGHYRYGPRQEAFYEKLLYQGNCLSPSAMTIRTGVLRQLNGFDLSEAFDAAADYDMWLRMAEQGKKIHFLVDVLGEFCITGMNKSMVKTDFELKVANIVQSHLLRFEKKPLYKVSMKGKWRLFRLYMLAMKACFLKSDYKTLFKCFQKAIVVWLSQPVSKTS